MRLALKPGQRLLVVLRSSRVLLLCSSQLSLLLIVSLHKNKCRLALILSKVTPSQIPLSDLFSLVASHISEERRLEIYQVAWHVPNSFHVTLGIKSWP